MRSPDDRPCIKITPADPLKPTFTLCGRQTDNVISSRDAGYLTPESRSAWVCTTCARKFRPSPCERANTSSRLTSGVN
jgi:hypothetical protein